MENENVKPTTSPIKKKRSWSEVNKSRKEEKKQRRESKLKKQSEKSNSEPIQSEPEISVDNEKETIDSRDISTVSIAVPGSILENAQSLELRTYLAGQIARAACIFQVDEVVVFDDYGDEASAKKSSLESYSESTPARHSCVQLGRILQYLECPQYLRKHLFPIHNDLKYCGILNPLNAPHHLGSNEYFPFREGVVMNKPSKTGQGSFVNVGLLKEVHVDMLLPPGMRCTVKLMPQNEQSKKLKGLVVSPKMPRKETGVYWGYTVRIATSLSKVFSQCKYENGYDLTVGTSDKGTSVDNFTCPPFKHLLVMFGGLHGIEAALENDQVLKVDDPKLLFDEYLNTLPDQGSKTIRTEEAILVSMAVLRAKLNPENRPKDMGSFNLDAYSNNIDNADQEEVYEENKDNPMGRFD